MEGKVILVAEDEEFNFLLLKYILEKEGYRVIRALNGVEVLDLFNSGIRIDLIIMDVKMPVMSGLEATIEIRKKNRKLPIIALTAYALPGDREMCMGAGSTDYIPKPIDKTDFLGRVRNLLA
ncbi:MAG: response regulator [Bacteroidales bacterium]|jgi:CheY-like chemotaxis protein|nr:response regulator [Bacteroidales bacterium]